MFNNNIYEVDRGELRDGAGLIDRKGVRCDGEEVRHDGDPRRDAAPRRDEDPPVEVPPDAMRLLLEGFYNITRIQATKVIDEGYDSLTEFIYWYHEDVKAWCTGKTKLSPTRGGCSFGDPKIKNIQALAYWATDLHKRGVAFIPRTFTPDILVEYKKLLRVQQLASKQSSDVEIPKPLQNEKWETWETALNNYLMSRKGVNDVPLAYVIRQIPRDNTTVPTRDRNTLWCTIKRCSI